MNYYGALFWIVLTLGGIAFAFFWFFRHYRDSALEAIDRLPFPERYETILARTPHFPRLSPDDRESLRRSILRFIHTKKFVGIGITVDDEMRVLVAFYASLLLLRKNAPLPYPDLSTILIYPDAVLIEQKRSEGGITTSEEVAIDGQSANGTVVITWDAARSEALAMGPDNLILHEFAHEIDFMDGEIDGIPPLDEADYDAWVEVLEGEFDALDALLHGNEELGKYDLFGPDAALDEAEFFAVATERFFGEGETFKKDFPKLYGQLRNFYGTDTSDVFR